MVFGVNVSTGFSTFQTSHPQDRSITVWWFHMLWQALCELKPEAHPDWQHINGSTWLLSDILTMSLSLEPSTCICRSCLVLHLTTARETKFCSYSPIPMDKKNCLPVSCSPNTNIPPLWLVHSTSFSDYIAFPPLIQKHKTCLESSVLSTIPSHLPLNSLTLGIFD